MSQEKPNPQPPKSPSNSNLEASNSPDEEPFLGKTINSSQTPSVLEKFQSMWNDALVKIRSLLPENLASKLSDRALTGIIVAIALVFVGVSVSTFTQKPKEIATVTPQAEAPNSNSIPKTQSVESIALPKEKIAQSPVSTEPIQLTPNNTKSSSKVKISPVKEISEPQVSPPINEEKISSNLEGKKQLPVLTPEQTLVGIIENQITQVTSHFNEDTKDQTFSSKLIQSVQADFASSTLTLKISDDWYSLEKLRQDKLAADILKRSKELDFTHLEITDSENKLVARNPIVGKEMIIFKR